MQNNTSSYLFQPESMPNFGNQRLPQNVWNRIKYKLDLFQQNGGTLINPITGKPEDFNPIVDMHKNCFSEVLQVNFIDCNSGVDPGWLKGVPRGSGNPPYKFDVTEFYKDNRNLNYDPKAFHEKLIRDLEDDDIKLNIPLDQISEYYPCIGYSYIHNMKYAKGLGAKPSDLDDMDFHFIAVGKNESDGSYQFSERTASQKPIYHYSNVEQLIQQNFDKSLYSADVFFIPKDCIGTNLQPMTTHSEAESNLPTILFLPKLIKMHL